MDEDDLTKAARKFLDGAIIMWATPIFLGSVWGLALRTVCEFFRPWITRTLEGIATIDLPLWMYIVAGLAIQLVSMILRGKPLLRDGNREQLDAFEHIVDHLPPVERLPFYRRMASKLYEQFTFDAPTRPDLKALGASAIKEVKEEELADTAQH